MRVRQMTLALLSACAAVLAPVILMRGPHIVSANSSPVAISEDNGTLVTISEAGDCTITSPNAVYVGTARRIGAPKDFVHFICEATLVSGTPVDKPTLPFENAGECITPLGVLMLGISERPGGSATAFCSNGHPPDDF